MTEKRGVLDPIASPSLPLSSDDYVGVSFKDRKVRKYLKMFPNLRREFSRLLGLQIISVLSRSD